MNRAIFTLSLLLVSCTVDTKPLCPDRFTPDDEACAWRYCQSHSGDPLCGDAGGGPEAGAVADASGIDARIDASDAAADADAGGCRTNAECPSTQPFCLASGACVACVEDATCPETAPSCVAGACARCTTSVACARFPTASACDTVSGGCVACTSTEAGSCTAAGDVCKTGGTTCVDCNTNAECTTAAASRCEGNACGACTVDADCTQVSGKPVCNAGTCVACTPATEAKECGEFSCNPDTLACTTTKRASRATCYACQADSECLANHKCVQVPFKGNNSGFHCMKALSTGCAEPYGSIPFSASSKSGAASAQYCSHRTATASCEAVVSLISGRSCTTATAEGDCGAGALCGAINGVANRCAYSCSIDLECPSATPCNEQSAANSYCGGPAL